MRRLFACLSVSLIVLPFGVGCGGSKMGDVRGKILYKGQPVTTGVISFMPKVPENQLDGGRPATGVPDEKGEFRLSTFAKHDGALVGTHTVIYGAPNIPESDDKNLLAKQAKLVAQFGKAKVPPGFTVEIKPGRNDVTLNLVD